MSERKTFDIEIYREYSDKLNRAINKRYLKICKLQEEIDKLKEFSNKNMVTMFSGKNYAFENINSLKLTAKEEKELKEESRRIMESMLPPDIVTLIEEN